MFNIKLEKTRRPKDTVDITQRLRAIGAVAELARADASFRNPDRECQRLNADAEVLALYSMEIEADLADVDSQLRRLEEKRAATITARGIAGRDKHQLMPREIMRHKGDRILMQNA
jgi:hypothetical protein